MGDGNQEEEQVFSPMPCVQFAGWLEGRVTITPVPGAYGGGTNPLHTKERKVRFQDTVSTRKERMLSSNEERGEK